MQSILGLIGLVVAFIATNHHTAKLLILIAVFVGAILHGLVKLLPKYITSFTVYFFSNLISFLLIAPFIIWQGFNVPAALMTTKMCLILLTYTVLIHLLFPLFWSLGAKKITSSKTFLFIGMVPVSTVVLSYIFLQEKLCDAGIIALLCILGALYVGVKRTQK